MTVIPINLVCTDKRGVTYIAGTKMKVRQIVLEKKVWGLTPEEIQQGHEHLSLAQIYAALAYYYEHQAEIDGEIEQAGYEVERLRAQQPNPLTRRDFDRRALQQKVMLPA